MGFKDMVDDRLTLIRRTSMLPRWAEICGVGEEYEKVDLSHPIVHLEYLLCDTKIMKKLASGEREEVLSLLTEEEKAIYLNPEPDEDGARYTDLENPKIIKQIAKDMKRVEREERKQQRKLKRV